MSKRITGEGPNPSGICMCGCGERTALAKQGHAAKGWVKGKPVRYVGGHCKNVRSAKDSTVERVLLSYVVEDRGFTSPCWIWQRYVSPAGYGIATAYGHNHRAHRFYYEAYVGPIPQGMDIDHLCRHRDCVNPAHMEPVSRRENVRRGGSVRLSAHRAGCVREMLTLGFTRAQVARLHGICISHVDHIRAGLVWAD